MNSFRRLLVLSIALAAFACAIPFPWLESPSLGLAFAGSFCASILWGVVLLYGFRLFGRRGAWLLVGLPLCLLWPALDLITWASCQFLKDCI